MSHTCIGWVYTFIHVTWLFGYGAWLLHTYNKTRLCVWHDAFTCETWHIHMREMTYSYAGVYMLRDCFNVSMCDLTHFYVKYDFVFGQWQGVRWLFGHWYSYAWHDSYRCAKRLIHVCDMKICVTWLIHMCDMNYSYVWRESLAFIYIWDTFYSPEWHGWCICVTWFIHVCDMTVHTYIMTYAYVCTPNADVWHESFIRGGHVSFIRTWMALSMHMNIMTGSRAFHDWIVSMPHDIFVSVTWLIHTWNPPHSSKWHDAYILVPWLIHIHDMIGRQDASEREGRRESASDERIFVDHKKCIDDLMRK